jgi:ferredoxin
MESPYDETAETCIGCGACVYVCPTNCIGIKEENNIRSIIKWHRDLPMQACTKCGRPFAPTFQLMHFASQIKVEKSHFDACPECR